MSRTLRISTRNATFQQWQALLTNRTKRHRAGQFLVQGVRPITLALRNGWPVHAVLRDGGRRLSEWARTVLDETPAAAHYLLDTELMGELGGKDEGVPELLAVVGMPPDDLSRIFGPARPDLLVVVFDRPTSPANVGAVIRSADAFGATGLVITGHGADPYDPKAVRAGTGSLFALPVVQAPGHREVLDEVFRLRRAGLPVQILGSDEGGEVDVADHDLTGPTLIAIGNETRGLSAGWREACDHIVRIPMTGAASSLNAASAAAIVLYETGRQRRTRPPA